MQRENSHEMLRNAKNSVFTYLFRIPEYTLRLYREMHPEDEDVGVDDIEIVTLEQVDALIYLSRRHVQAVYYQQ